MIIGAMLVRNESGRYLERVLEQMQQVCDRIVIVDDCSTDDTVEICRSYGADVYQHHHESLFVTNELELRKGLWNAAARNHGDWILCLDADEALSNPEKLREMIALAEQRGCDALAFRLYDMWSETHYRNDHLWNAHKRFWPMCVRYDERKDYDWLEQPLHCGRFPLNAYKLPMDAKIDILHWGWSREAERKAKYERYMSIDTQGLGSREQYESILDSNPRLLPYGAKRILIGGPVRQDETTFRLYLDSLDKLDTSGLHVDLAFILHNCPELESIANQYNRPGREVVVVAKLDDESDYKRSDTHEWKSVNLSTVAQMRNHFLALARHYDALFMVDSDLLLHPQTLQMLVKADKPIVSNVFWTRWSPNDPEMPNAWMVDNYGFDEGRIEKWREPGLHQVGMTGACTLIRREVIEAGVNYSPIPNVSITTWEDRAFCIRAAVAGFEIWMDTTYPARHLYREEDVKEVLKGAEI